MKTDFSDLRSVDFAPLSEAKAKLSEFIRRLSGGKRIVLTTNGRPTAVLISYRDFLSLLSPAGSPGPEPGADVIRLEDWEKDRPKREKIKQTILGLFDVASLSRKGQKAYKKEKVDEFRRNNSLEDIIVNKLRAFKYEKSAVDGVNALLLLELGDEDERRLGERAKAEDVENALEAVRAVREESIRKKLSRKEANRLLEKKMREL